MNRKSHAILEDHITPDGLTIECIVCNEKAHFGKNADPHEVFKFKIEHHCDISKPANRYKAVNPDDLRTPRQIGLIAGLSKAHKIFADDFCKAQTDCELIELNKRGAQLLIDLLKNQDAINEYKRGIAA